MGLVRPFAHIQSRFAENGRCRQHINAINLGQIRTVHAKQLRTQFELRHVPFLLFEPRLPLLFRQGGTLAAVLLLLEILLELLVASSHLLLAKIETLLFLMQHKEQVFLPVALQILRDLFLARFHPNIPKRSELMRIAFTRQNG
jgi:hypothetical protein